MIAVAAGGLGLFWAATEQRAEDRARLTNVATSNALFLENLSIPRSRKLADSLTEVAGSKVGFFLPDQSLVEGRGWTENERTAALLARQSEPQIAVAGRSHALVRAIADGTGSIVVVEPVGPFLPLSTTSPVIPLLGMTLLAVAAAFLIARSVVRPLQNLASGIYSSPSEEGIELPPGLTQRHDEIGVLARTLVQERSALLEEQELRRNSEKMALLGQLATSLAHEIKNPAAAIILHAKLLEESQDGPEGRIIREEGEHITSLVNQWLFVARPRPPRSSNCDLSALLRSLADRMAPLLDFQNCRLQLDLPESLVISCDSQRIEQVFRNLIDNAIKAMPSGGIIHMQLSSADDGGAQFTITDEGDGFSVTALSRFGETFYSEREGGMGLGLALATGVIRAHGGTLAATNLTQGGACVTGTLSRRSTTA